MSLQDTSGTNPFYSPRVRYEYQWTPPQKHCGGITKCGKLCHKGINLVILKRDGDKIKAYCTKCDEFIAEGEVSNECHE